MRKRGAISECKTLQVLFALVLIFSVNFVRAELDLTLNAKSNGFDTDFYLQTDSAASSGFDFSDFEQQSFPSGNYSFLTSTVSGKNLIIDSFPSSNRTVYLVYRVNPAESDSLSLSWVSSALGYHYDGILTDYGSDSGYTSSVSSNDMYSSSSYSVVNSLATRYFSLGINYFNFSCGDGVCNGERRGETCSSCSADCGACSSGDTGGTSSGGTAGTTCEDSEWTVTSVGLCSYETRIITLKSNCGNTKTEGERCCEEDILNGTWSECTRQNTRTRNIEQIYENCEVVDSVETGSCTYQCSEEWVCDWGSCQNGFINPTNCVEKNNCGTEDNKPTALSCTQEGNITQVLINGLDKAEQSFFQVNPNCSINFICGEWSACEVKTGMEDIKNAQGNLDGVRSRKCVDQNNCLGFPYYDQQRCSLKVFITPKKENFCGQDYLSIYEQGTDYLLARIKDNRQTQGTFSVQFVLGGKSPDIGCNPAISKEYNYSSFDKFMGYSNIRRLWGLVQ